MRISAAFVLSALVTLCPSARADEADFFRNKTITVSIGTGPGGGYDNYGRLFARHLGKHVPGTPNVITQNVPGASSIVLSNVLYNKAPRDGTAMGIINQTMAIESSLGGEGVQFDAGRFTWIGRLSSVMEIAVVWHTSPTRTIADALKRETIVGSAGPSSSTSIFPNLLNSLIGTKFKVITGFRSNSEVLLAIERQEIEGAGILLDGFAAFRGDWLTDKKLLALYTWCNEREPTFPDAPALPELTREPEARQILSFYGSACGMGRGIVAPPDLPPERAATMRRAFDAVMADAAFREDAAKAGLELKTLPGEKYQALALEAATFPRALVGKAKAAREAR